MGAVTTAEGASMESERQNPGTLGAEDGVDEEEDPIQEAEEESFPASDPPSQWAG
jgi:hypothetical protein